MWPDSPRGEEERWNCFNVVCTHKDETIWQAYVLHMCVNCCMNNRKVFSVFKFIISAG